MRHIQKQKHTLLEKEHSISPFSLYLKEIVYGGTDGIVTTFAVVAGFAGAQTSLGGALPVLTVLLFGLANLFADGVSMAFGNFLATRSEHDVYKNEEQKERTEVTNNHKEEVEETITLLTKKGFTKEQAETLTSIYKTNKPFWVTFMMQEELLLSNPDGERPERMAFATFVSFVGFGLLPLVPYMFFAKSPHHLFLSIMTTIGSLSLLGYFRYKVTGQGLVRAMSESLLLGGSAAAVAYIVGTLFSL